MLFAHPNPVIGKFLIGGSGTDPATRFVNLAGWNLTRSWRAMVETHVWPARSATGLRRWELHNPGGHSRDGRMSWLQFNEAARETPSLCQDFVAAWKPIMDAGDEVIVYLGGLFIDWEKMSTGKGADAATYLRRAVDAARFVLDNGFSLGIDAANQAGNADVPWWKLIEFLESYLAFDRGERLFPRVYTEGQPQVGDPQQHGFSFIVEDRMYQHFQRSYPGHWREDLWTGEAIRLCDNGSLPPDRALLSFPQSWERAHEWVPDWIDGAVKLGHSAAITPKHLIAAGVTVDRWARQ